MGMNIEIANKLYRLRKQNGFSQEELASRLGISRQAVSKWERAEVSPDTDNLIALARLYNISLDELLLGEDRGDAGRKPGAAGGGDGEKDENTAREDASHVSFRGGGIHVVEPDGSEVHVGIKGIYVNDTKTGEKVNVGCGHVYAEQNAAGPDSGGTGSAPAGAQTVCGGPAQDGADLERRRRRFHAWKQFPYPVFACIVFLLWGFWGDEGWSVSWLFLLTIPLYYTLINAIEHRNAHHFAYPVLVLIAYLGVGMFCSVWHPTWVMFITIPLYYSLAEALRR